MRYHEIYRRHYYVSADDELIGDLTGGNIPREPGPAAVEEQLEKFRPASKIPRLRSLCLYAKPIGDRRFCYEVQPLSPVEKYHTGWLSRLTEADPNQQGVVASYAERFWKGLLCPDHAHEPWELRVSAARILCRVGGSGRDIKR